MANAVGIDLGTTNSVIATMEGGKKGLVNSPPLPQAAKRLSASQLHSPGDGARSTS